MSWQQDGRLDWRRTPVAGGVRLEVRDRMRMAVGVVCGGGLVAVLAWAFFARLDSASRAALVVHGALTVMLAVFSVVAVVGRSRIEVAGGRLVVPGVDAMGVDEVADVVVVRRGGYAGLAVRRVDGGMVALPSVYLSKAKAEQVRGVVVGLLDEARG